VRRFVVFVGIGETVRDRLCRASPTAPAGIGLLASVEEVVRCSCSRALRNQTLGGERRKGANCGISRLALEAEDEEVGPADLPGRIGCAGCGRLVWIVDADSSGLPGLAVSKGSVARRARFSYGYRWPGSRAITTPMLVWGWGGGSRMGGRHL